MLCRWLAAVAVICLAGGPGPSTATLDGPAMLSRLHALLSYPSSLEVRLVGFDGRAGGAAVAPAELARYLATAAPKAAVSGTRISADIFFRVTAAPPALADDLAAAVAAAVAAAGAPAVIPHAEVDAALAADRVRASSSGASAVTLYIVHGSRRPTGPYAYRDAGADPPGCPGPLWASSDRYAVVDLGAGPAPWGPANGDGGVAAASLPRPAAAAAADRLSRGALCASLAALSLSAHRHLVLSHPLPGPLPAVGAPSRVLILHVRDVPRPGGRATRRRSGVIPGLDVAAVTSQLESLAVAAGAPPPTVALRSLTFASCPACAAAYASSLRTSPHARGGLVLHTGELRAALAAGHAAILAPLSLGPPPPPGTTTVIYVLDVRGSPGAPLLLDGSLQAVAYPRLVLSVRTRITDSVDSPAVCGLTGAGRGAARLHPAEITRPVIGALLSAAWGVAPTEAVVGTDPGQPHSRVDYTWSLGTTPYGPFGAPVWPRRCRGAPGPSLPFAAVDAAARNAALGALNRSVTTATRLAAAIGALEALPAAGGVPALTGRARHRVTSLWSDLEAGVSRAVSLLGALQLGAARSQAEATGDVLIRLEAELTAAATAAQATHKLTCDVATPGWAPGAWGLPWGTVVALLAACSLAGGLSSKAVMAAVRRRARLKAKYS